MTLVAWRAQCGFRMNFSEESGLVRRKGGFRQRKWSGISRIAAVSDRLRYSPQAQLDLDEIFDYFADELGNPQKGESIVR